jgi:ParE toxin of type II toxin-antitoxin system, parDE
MGGSAVLKLAEAWTRAESADRAAITAASHRIEEALRLNPREAGESRDDERRIFIDLPLVVIYEVDDDNGVVTVLDLVVPG